MLLRSNNRRQRPKLPAPVATIEAHVTAFNTAVGGIISQAGQIALSALYADLVAAGLWNRIWILNVFLNDAEGSKFNFRDYTKYKFSYPNGIGVDSLGVFTNGTNQYYKTGFVPAVAAPANQDSFGLHVFNKMLGVPASGTTETSGVSNSNGSMNIRLQSAAIVEGKSQKACYVNSAMTVTGATYKTNTTAGLSLQRTDANTVNLYQFGQKVHEVTASASAGLPATYELTGMARGGSVPSSFTGEYHSHYAVTASFSDAEMVVFNQALMKYHISIGRYPKSDIFFGDSITHGMSVASFAAWPYRLAILAGSFCQNWAVSGERIGANNPNSWAYPANKAAWQVPAYNSAIHNRIFVALSTNDLVQSMSASQFGTDLTYVLNLFVARGWPASKIVIIPTYCQKTDSGGAGRIAYNTTADSVCAGFPGVRCLSGLYTAMKASPDRDTLFYGSDLVHPLAFGHDFIANYIFSQIGAN